MHLKLLFLSHRFYPDIGGIEVNSEILATAFHNAGHEVRLMTWTGDVDEKVFPFPVIRQPAISSIFEQHRWANIVFENNPCLRLAWPGIFFGKPYIVALRTWVTRMNGKTGLQDIVKKQWLKNASAVIAVSEAVRLKSWHKATVIGNPYRTNLFRIMDGVPRTKNFVFLGRLVSDKGAHIAVNAINILKKRHVFADSECTLTIVGDGDQKEYLKELVKTQSLENNVFFEGSLSGEKLVNCLNQHKYLIVPSIWEEPFGNVALEGMACGCIPIVSNGGGLPDAVGNAGIMFDRGNTEDLVSSIIKIVQDPSLQQKLHDLAPLHLYEHQPGIVARRYLAVIENVFAG